MIYLASASPRRRELLKEIIPDFRIVVSDAEEIADADPVFTVTQNAIRKASAVGCGRGDTVIAADTVVWLEGRLLLKPRSESEALAMLKSLAGRTHFVYTGYAIRTDSATVADFDCSEVYIHPMTERQIADYVATGSPMDKAGAYGIQDEYIKYDLKGSFSNVMGLPVEKLRNSLSLIGL